MKQKEFKSVIEQAIKKAMRNIERLSGETQTLLSDKGKKMRELNELIERFEQEKAKILGQMEGIDKAIEMKKLEESHFNGELKALKYISEE